ncbi:MAG: PAS domain-containing sensor histidine kinase [Acidimicrobiia bacterium]
MSRDSTVATVWRDLNRVALRVGAVAGFAASGGYVLLFLATDDLTFLATAMLASLVGVAGLVGMTRAADAELVIVAAALTAIAAGLVTSPMVRGGLWAAIAVLAVIGGLLLPVHKQRRFIAFIALLLIGQLTWPLFGSATLVEAISNFVVSGTLATAGIAMVTIARRALEQSEQTRIAIFRSVPVGLFRCAVRGELIDANPALAQMLGYDDPDDLIGRRLADLHETPADWDALVKLLEEDDEPRRFANRMVSNHGTGLWVRGFAQVIRDENGAVLCYEGSVEDVTQRREAEVSRRKAEDVSRRHAERFRNVFERAPIALWEEDYSRVGRRLQTLRATGVTDIRGHLEGHPDEVCRLLDLITFIDVNPAGVALIGASSKEEALKNVLSDTAPPLVIEGFIEEFIAIWEDREETTLEITGSTMGGDATDLALSWATGRHPDGSLDLARVVVAIQDIAVIRRAERELAALVESKDELIASVSHELRTPITTILGMAFELRDRGEDFSIAEARELVELIADQSRELSNIVEDLLVAARAEAGTLSVRPEEIDIGAEIGQIVPFDDANPVIEIPDQVWAWADPLRFRQILRNLLTNAARYGGDRVTVEAETIDDVAVIRMRDNGVGIPRDEREAIFDPYVRSADDAALPGSMGLGLPLSRQLARLMGGDLAYRYDGSSVFELTLPVEGRGTAA